jgi:hypothetical protein
MTVRPLHVIPDAAKQHSGIHIPCVDVETLGLWIPGSPLRGAPE